MRFFKIIVFVSVIMAGAAMTVPSRAMGQLFFFSHPLKGKAAENFSLKTTKGEVVDFNEFRAGRPAVLFFWATWCPHCREQIKQLNARARDIERQNIALVLIDLEEPEPAVKAYLARNNISLPVFLDEQAETAVKYSIMGVPTFFLINKEGIVESVQHTFPEDLSNISN